jgi:hypothetical protein
MCPRALNPSQPNGLDYTLVFSTRRGATSSSGELSGAFGLFFAGQTATLPFPANEANATAAMCEASFESLPNVADVSCFRVANNSAIYGNGTYVVRVNAWSGNFDSYMNNMWHHDGDPAITHWACDS